MTPLMRLIALLTATTLIENSVNAHAHTALLLQALSDGLLPLWTSLMIETLTPIALCELPGVALVVLVSQTIRRTS